MLDIVIRRHFVVWLRWGEVCVDPKKGLVCRFKLCMFIDSRNCNADETGNRFEATNISERAVQAETGYDVVNCVCAVKCKCYLCELCHKRWIRKRWAVLKVELSG